MGQKSKDEKTPEQLQQQLEQLQKDLEQLQKDLERERSFGQMWSISYERAIVEKQPNSAKAIIDLACYKAVEEWTNRLFRLGYITEIKGRVFATIKESVYHHIENLVKGGMWKDETQPKIELKETVDGEEVYEVTVSSCSYKEVCRWGLEVPKFLDSLKSDIPEFLEDGGYRCQRLGCFVGAAKKYTSEDTLPENRPEKLTYFMTQVNLTDKNEACQGLIFVDPKGIRAKLLTRYQTTFTS
jgi:hypothetical protein